MTILTNSTSSEVCTHIGEQFFDNKNLETFEFRIGQRVKTILGQNVRTQKHGFIINRFKHEKENTNIYQILVDGKTLDKRYFPNELEIE